MANRYRYRFVHWLPAPNQNSTTQWTGLNFSYFFFLNFKFLKREKRKKKNRQQRTEIEFSEKRKWASILLKWKFVALIFWQKRHPNWQKFPVAILPSIPHRIFLLIKIYILLDIGINHGTRYRRINRWSYDERVERWAHLRKEWRARSFCTGQPVCSIVSRSVPAELTTSARSIS